MPWHLHATNLCYSYNRQHYVKQPCAEAIMCSALQLVERDNFGLSGEKNKMKVIVIKIFSKSFSENWIHGWFYDFPVSTLHKNLERISTVLIKY